MTQTECCNELAMIRYRLDLIEIARLCTLTAEVRAVGVLVARFLRVAEAWGRLQREGKDGA